MNKAFPITYETFGNPRNPCIILIMGIGGQLIHWPSEFTEGLVNKGFYVVTFDNRDSGLSQYYDHLPTPDVSEAIALVQQGGSFDPPYTLEDMASDVILLMDKLNIEKAHIAGISMGGIIAQIFALEYPERILSLTCISSTSGDPHLPSAKPEVMQFFFSKQGKEENAEDYVNSKMQLYKIYNHPDYVDENKVRELYLKTYHRANNPAGFKRQLFAMMCAKPRIEKLKKLQLSTLIIHGDYDPTFPLEHGKHLHECIPNSQFEIIEKMGHGIPEVLCKRLVDLCCKHLTNVVKTISVSEKPKDVFGRMKNTVFKIKMAS